MASYNRVILMGNLTRDPEVRQAQSGTHVAKTGLAINERVPDGQGGWREETSFVDIVVFGRRGEAFGQYMEKGRPVLIEGKLRQSTWQDRETGQNRSKIEVIVDNWEFVGGRGDGRGGSGSGGGQRGGEDSAQPRQGAGAGRQPDFPSAGDFSEGGYGDVPF